MEFRKILSPTESIGGDNTNEEKFPSSEQEIMNGIENIVLDEGSFEDFRQSHGFTEGHHGTFHTKDENMYLYKKPCHLAKTEDMAKQALESVRLLTEKGALYPNTKWGIYKTKEELFQLFAVTRRLQQYTEEQQEKEGHQFLLRGINEANNYDKMFDANSHVLDWYKRVDPDFDPFKEPSKDSLLHMLNPYEASFPSNWAWDESGKLYPIDVEVIDTSIS
jgi:hypothetical protein